MFTGDILSWWRLPPVLWPGLGQARVLCAQSTAVFRSRRALAGSAAARRPPLVGSGLGPLRERLLDAGAAVEREAKRCERGAGRPRLVPERHVERGPLAMPLGLCGEGGPGRTGIELTEEHRTKESLAASAWIQGSLLASHSRRSASPDSLIP